ncbi:MAG TPA: response regulator, partial [Thermodesulfobacteriota bacterium]|nr:response regulator [Thermodesulfobacteriota bacterium]
MRILIVDDDNDSRFLLMQTLRRLGHEVISAVNGVEAWEVLEREEIGFIISDWMMPRMDGLELCRRIRAARFPRYIYVILLTAKDNKNELIEGMKAGADDFLVKPFNVGELDVRIKAGERVLRLERDLE